MRRRCSSLAAPLFLLVVDILAVALPYRLPRVPASPLFARLIARYPEIGGLPLLHVPVFGVTVGCELIIAVLVLLGLRWLTLGVLAASVLYWVAAGHSMPWIPYPLQLVTTGAYLLVAAALIASPGPRRGRQLVNWRYGVVLLVAAGAVQVSTVAYNAMTPFWRRAMFPPEVTIYLAGSVVLAAAVLAAAVMWKLNWSFLLILAAMSWPYAIQLAFTATAAAPICSATPRLLTSPRFISRPCCSPAGRCSRPWCHAGPASSRPEVAAAGAGVASGLQAR